MHSKPISEIINREIRFEPSRSSGPGGQNVNKKNTRVTGLWNFSVSRLITTEQKNRIADILKNRVSMGRTLIVSGQKHKLQNQNKKEVVEIMARLVTHALKEEKERISTKPTPSSKNRRIESKKIRSSVKKLRSGIGE